MTSQRPFAAKEGKCANLIAAVKADWQPFPKLLAMTGWLPHTMRGYIYRVGKAEHWTVDRRAQALGRKLTGLTERQRNEILEIFRSIS